MKNRIKYAFSINELDLTGDRQINLKIKQILSPYSNTKIKNEKIFILKIFSSSEKITTAKVQISIWIVMNIYLSVKIQLQM